MKRANSAYDAVWKSLIIRVVKRVADEPVVSGSAVKVAPGNTIK